MLTKDELIERLRQKKYKRFSDAENSWLRVPKADVEIVGIQKKISKKSKISEKYVFLNGENDEPEFLMNLFEKQPDVINFIKKNIEYVYNEKPSYINEYSEYSYYLL